VQNNINKFMGKIIFVAAMQRLSFSKLAARRSPNPTLKVDQRACSELAVIRSKTGIIS
jgi:hypothetical protein